MYNINLARYHSRCETRYFKDTLKAVLNVVETDQRNNETQIPLLPLYCLFVIFQVNIVAYFKFLSTYLHFISDLLDQNTFTAEVFPFKNAVLYVEFSKKPNIRLRKSVKKYLLI